MRKFLLAPVFALSLTACQTTGGGTIADYIAQVQSITQTACGFLPIAAELTGLQQSYPTAAQAAQAICAALGTRQVSAVRRLGAAADASAVVTVNVYGTRVRGYMVR